MRMFAIQNPERRVRENINRRAKEGESSFIVETARRVPKRKPRNMLNMRAPTKLGSTL
jgi:hypothetical protein